MIHTLHDGSRLMTMSAKELIRIPVWKGNRIIDMDHVHKIKESVGHSIQKLEFSYRIATILEEDAAGNPVKASYIIDGQHRHRVMFEYFQENLCEPDFPVIVLEKRVQSEDEIIAYFRELNTQKPIEWKTDPVLIENIYISALSKEFNQGKDTLIRSGPTRRPYISSDSLRTEFRACGAILTDSPEKVKTFIQRVVEYNAKELANASMSILHANKTQAIILQKAASQKFMLATNPKLPWIRECLAKG